MPILLVSCCGIGGSLCWSVFKIMIVAVKLTVLFAAILTYSLSYAGSCAACVSVIDCYGNLCGVACIVCNNNSYCTNSFCKSIFTVRADC